VTIVNRDIFEGAMDNEHGRALNALRTLGTADPAAIAEYMNGATAIYKVDTTTKTRAKQLLTDLADEGHAVKAGKGFVVAEGTEGLQ
jgi:hypothetical protein